MKMWLKERLSYGIRRVFFLTQETDLVAQKWTMNGREAGWVGVDMIILVKWIIKSNIFSIT